MDHRQFDDLVKDLYALKNRREGLRIGVAGVVAGTIALIRPGETLACKGRGDRCQKNDQCCSGQCVDRKSKKNKKARKGKKARKNRQGAEGDCDCSGLQERCKGPTDCCVAAQFCRATSCSTVPVCCKVRGSPCADDCDCCDDDSFCDEESGRCDDCRDLKKTRQGPCETADDCCFEGDICKSIDPACPGREGDTQCCVSIGNECDEDCDCCVPLKCKEGVCALPDGCSDSGDICAGSGGPIPCCNQGDRCSTAICNGDVEVVCCHDSGPCEDDCDCCGSTACVSGMCGGENCDELREACELDNDCCAPLSCANNNEDCPGLPIRFCCGNPNDGVECEDDCDCCGGVKCFDGLCGGS